MKTFQSFPRVILGLLFFAFSSAVSVAEEAPRLILQITVDQLRGDYPFRYERHMGEDGFRFLMEEGVWYRNAHHAHANTETIVGHATLATGADPATHGMVGNNWFDRGTGKLVYNIEDADYHILTEGADVDASTEIDPTQKVASTDGRSPRVILGSTFSDELALHTAGNAKIFGVSVKDRGAVSMAGHAGKAFWFSKQAAEFVTSSYYYERYPEWVVEWNKQGFPQTYANTSWELSEEASAYIFGDADDMEWETDFPGYGRVFPHAYGPADGKYFTTLLTLSPAGDELTLNFAKTLMVEEEIGQDDITDYLSVSFSSTDYVGHLFGPSSLEAEDNFLRLDRTLAELFEFVDEQVGLEHTVIVLSADHGGPEAPGYLNSLGIDAEYVNPDEWDKTPGLEKLKKQFGVGEELILSYSHPYIYLNRELIEKKDLDIEAVEAAVAEEVNKLAGVSLAVSSSALRNGDFPHTDLFDAVLRNYNPQRSGDVFVVFEPHCFINDFDGLEVSCTHGSPWMYDTHVPLVFVHPEIEAQMVTRPVEPLDLVATLVEMIGCKAPSGSRGVPLTEVVEEYE
jgi:predicted AlkP superfamily pyrophosphatase or phosphodiesterase